MPIRHSCHLRNSSEVSSTRFSSLSARFQGPSSCALHRSVFWKHTHIPPSTTASWLGSQASRRQVTTRPIQSAGALCYLELWCTPEICLGCELPKGESSPPPPHIVTYLYSPSRPLPPTRRPLAHRWCKLEIQMGMLPQREAIGLWAGGCTSKWVSLGKLNNRGKQGHGKKSMFLPSCCLALTWFHWALQASWLYCCPIYRISWISLSWNLSAVLKLWSGTGPRPQEVLCFLPTIPISLWGPASTGSKPAIAVRGFPYTLACTPDLTFWIP